MSGIASSALNTDVRMVVAVVLEGFGVLCLAFAAPTVLANRSFGWMSGFRWVDQAMRISVAGALITVLGALLAGNWALASAAVALIGTFQLLREQRPDRPERRLLLRSFSGVVAQTGFRLSRDKETYAAAVVRVERANRSCTYSLPQIREELVGAILAAAKNDDELDYLLHVIESEIEATVRGVARVDARPTSARYRMATYAKINDFANSVLDQATDPDAHRTVRPYAQYSATMLKLAAACRLAERSVATPTGA